MTDYPTCDMCGIPINTDKSFSVLGSEVCDAECYDKVYEKATVVKE